ncbi:hypothetical protein [Streptomyces sp. TN58]|uniref:hypothetical protein n=1 Tax=Streptomyces sp. TN58 TaxID=234612 RepID=UPI0013317F62|nr:hypothetical protein [Streptomyces sp. TN58]
MFVLFDYESGSSWGIDPVNEGNVFKPSEEATVATVQAGVRHALSIDLGHVRPRDGRPFAVCMKATRNHRGHGLWVSEDSVLDISDD